ncbi:hypothetical protein [Exiguobacterium antarcticum]|uniref:hypothetical protein n=1 Tax=Exiguobacterium antarcticum TaxID=132920 RepID=UPI0002E68ABA|nr:hypothetical protein [Exiguobacterium antarcticum]
MGEIKEEAIFIDGTKLEELTIPELEHIGDVLEERIASINQEIETSSDTQERKRLRSERKQPHLFRKKVAEFVERKRKYAVHKETFDGRNSYRKNLRET